MNAVEIVQRKGEVMQSAPKRYISIRAAAETLSLRNADQAVVELFMEALSRLVDLAYEQDSGGYCNIDAVTHRLLIPLPFGRAGHAKWGIRPQEANILRAILFQRQFAPGLFQYDRSRRCWRINLHDFPTHDHAMNYLTRQPISIKEYRAAHVATLSNA